jgi:hypothetical protein
MTYATRLKELNTIGTKTVWDSIDRPIRPLIYELNRIGLKTKFSCCGFSYVGEEEPKSHARYPFVVFSVNEKSITSLFKVIDLTMQCGWSIIPYFKSQDWHISYSHVHNTERFYNDGTNSIHAYETPLIMIARLTEKMSSLPSIDGPIFIEDGNAHPSYGFLGGEWQVEPKPSVQLTLDLKEK